jgi:hypothetical protein
MKSHHPPELDYQRIETGSTGRGIPDVNYCHQGGEFWVELKIVKGRSIDLSPEQVAWHFRRTRAGGKTFIIARDKFDGPRKGKGDIIYIWPGCDVVPLKEKGLDCPGLVFKAPFDWDLLWMKLMQKT